MVNSEAVRRMGRKTSKYCLYENHGLFLAALLPKRYFGLRRNFIPRVYNPANYAG